MNSHFHLKQIRSFDNFQIILVALRSFLFRKLALPLSSFEPFYALQGLG